MLKVRATNAGRILLNIPYVMPKWTNPLVLVPALLIISGWATAFLRSGRLFDWYFAAYMGVLLLWPFDEGGRFLFPVLPWIYFYLIEGATLLHRFAEHLSPKRFFYALSGLAFVLAALAAYSAFGQGGFSKQDIMSVGFWSLMAISALVWISVLRGKYSNAAAHIVTAVHSLRLRRAVILLLIIPASFGFYKISGAARFYTAKSAPTALKPSTISASAWISSNTLKDDVVMVEDYAIVHRLTMRKTVRVPLTSDPEQIMLAIEAAGVKYIIVPKPAESEYFNPPVAARFKRFMERYGSPCKVVSRVNGGTIYMIKNGELRKPIK